MQSIAEERYSTDSMDIDAMQIDVPCQFACPALTDVPAYISAINTGDYGKAYVINRKSNIIPGILGRICTRPCEQACRHGVGLLGEPVGICRLKRVAADYKEQYQNAQLVSDSTGKRVAVVGSGPTGLAAANDLALLGHEVTIFESTAHLGGMLRLGIPAFRLPREIIQEEINSILDLGVKTTLKTTVGKDITLDEMLADYDAVLLALGCMKTRKVNIPGEDIEGVISGLEFMMDVNRGKEVTVGDRVAIIGGGYTSMDCARTAHRLGSSDINVFYWRSPGEITTDEEELHQLDIEAVKMHYLVSPLAFITGDDGKLAQVQCIRNQLSDPDPTGRRTPKPIDGSEFLMDIETAIIAVGQIPDSSMLITAESSSDFAQGYLTVDDQTLMAERPGLFAAGDYIKGTRSVIEAVADGRNAAGQIDAYLNSRNAKPIELKISKAENTPRQRGDDFIERIEVRTAGLKERLILDNEVELGYDIEEGHTESKRCYLCDLHFEIRLADCIYCTYCIEVAPLDCIKMVSSVALPAAGIPQFEEAATWDEVAAIYIDNSKCIRCGNCYRVCPTECITISRYGVVDPIHGEPK